MLSLPVFFFLVLGVLLFAWLVFRRIVRNEYRSKRRLSWWGATLETVVFALYANLAYAFLPVGWPGWPSLPDSQVQAVTGVGLMATGFVLTFSAMGYLGFAKAFGVQVDGLRKTGVYRYSRNPQIIFFALVLIGALLLWFHWYGLIWLGLYGVIVHMMVLTEEEHLLEVHGEDYQQYCREVPRYF